MWGSAIQGARERAGAGAEAPDVDDARPRVGRSIVILLLLAASVAFLVLPAAVGLGVLMGRTVALGLAFSLVLTALVGFKFLAFGFGLVGGVLSRPVDTPSE